jgi:hypothetical protein
VELGNEGNKLAVSIDNGLKEMYFLSIEQADKNSSL